MSIIIRLQNLPWAANSLDIRRYFQGLSIPEGGVHIVGGEKGDAFIAFGSDEDARQAMERDGGKIKEVRIKLLLSSRAEMQRIIDQARAQHTAPPPIKKEERRRSSPDDRSRRPPRDRSPRRRSSRRDRSHSRSPPYRSRDKDRSRSSRSDERRRSFDDPGRAPEPAKVSNGQTSERKGGWDEKPPYTDPSKAAPPVFPIGNMKQAARPQSDVSPAAPMNMACQPAALPNLAAFNLPPVNLMNNLPGLAANMMSGLMGPTGGDMMVGMTGNMAEGMPANMANNLPSNLAGQIGGGMPGSMPANMAGSMPGNIASQMPAAIPGGLAANIPGNMPGHMGGMTSAAGGIGANVSGGMAAAMPGNVPANMPGAFGMADAMGAPNMENMAPGFVDRRLDGSGQVERKSEGGPPGGARDVPPRHAEESCCVELRGLSGAPTPRNVKDFFRGLRIFSGCIRVATSETGIKSVVVRFANKWDAREAMQGDYKVLCGDPIQIVPFPEDLFEQTELLVSPSAALSNQGRNLEADMVVVMKGLPYNTSEQDVLQFFSGLNVLDILVEHDRSGRATGMAFVEFGDKRDFETAMSMQRRKIGHRYIELSVGTRDAMCAARNGDNIRPEGMPVGRRDEEHGHGVGPDRGPEVGHGPLHGPGMGPAGPAHGAGHVLVPPGHTCVSMLGLPNTVTDRDIADFFSIQGVIPRAIHIMLGANGVPTGHAFAEFGTHADCERAFLQDGANLGPHLIALKTIPYSEVAQALGGHHRPDGRPDGRPDNRYDNRFDGRFHDRGGDGRPERPGMRPEGRFESGPPGPPGPPLRDRDGPPKRPLLERASRPPLFPEGGPRRPPLFPDRGGPLPDRGGPLPDRGGPLPDRGGPLLRAPRHEEPPLPPRGMDSFGKPGCVVTATNIPYRAGVEDIINFFQGFELTKENVMRRFNDRGQVTGDARIAFPTPRDAQEALAKFNNRPMQGRAISLGLL